MEVLEWIAKYWVNWLCMLIAAGIGIFAKNYVKLQKKAMEDKWADKEKNMCGKIITTLEERIGEVETESQDEDERLHSELDHIHTEINAIETGILSIQGKQFRDMCERLLEQGHYINVDEYEEFESEYTVYKGLGGNHRGDALHDRVIDKVQAQMRAENRNFEEN